MQLIKDWENIADEDKPLAISIVKQLRMGDRVFGNPAEGLKITLKSLESKKEEESKNHNILDFMEDSSEWDDDIRKIKAGIKGEEDLAEYFERIVKYQDHLQDVIIFASLSDPNHNNGGEDYISDSDFIAVYGNSLLVLDAKNIRTNPELPIYLNENDELLTVGGSVILELHPSTKVWNGILRRQGALFHSISGCVVIVNKQGALVWKNEFWKKSDAKPIHISELVDFLLEWIENKDPKIDLSLLTAISKMQIRKKEMNTGLKERMKRFI